MSSLAFRFIFIASLFALAGMAWGIFMSSTGDHSLASAHAHNNLIGFVTMALYGIYYALVPSAGRDMLAQAHFWLALFGAILIGVGVALAITGQTEIVAIIASFATIAAMLMFAVIVFRHRSAFAA